MLFEKLDVGSILQTIHSTGLANLAQVAKRMGEPIMILTLMKWNDKRLTG